MSARRTVVKGFRSRTCWNTSASADAVSGRPSWPSVRTGAPLRSGRRDDGRAVDLIVVEDLEHLGDRPLVPEGVAKAAIALAPKHVRQRDERGRAGGDGARPGAGGV